MQRLDNGLKEVYVLSDKAPGNLVIYCDGVRVSRAYTVKVAGEGQLTATLLDDAPEPDVVALIYVTNDAIQYAPASEPQAPEKSADPPATPGDSKTSPEESSDGNSTDVTPTDPPADEDSDA